VRIAVISDLHLGCGDRSDRFGHDEGAFLGFLDGLERRFDAIAINGDLFETWQGVRFGRPREALAAARQRHGRLVARFGEAPYHLTWGNHDPLLAERGAVETLEFDADGLRVLLTHGHRFDPPIKRARPVAYTFCWTTGWLHRHQAHPAVERVNRLRGRIEARHLYNTLPQPWIDRVEEGVCPYQRGALSILHARPDLGIVAFGHTHVPAETCSPWGVYLNSGAMAGGRYAWAAIDTAARAFTVIPDSPDVDRAIDLLAARAGAWPPRKPEDTIHE